jgi:hypothetical protein
MNPRAAVTRPDCGLHESFDRVADARSLLDSHREKTGHVADWQVSRLSPGVDRAGDEAGDSGRPERATGSPLSRVDDDTESR